jgi:hypothetical protein
LKQKRIGEPRLIVLAFIIKRQRRKILPFRRTVAAIIGSYLDSYRMLSYNPRNALGGGDSEKEL